MSCLSLICMAIISCPCHWSYGRGEHIYRRLGEQKGTRKEKEKDRFSDDSCSMHERRRRHTASQPKSYFGTPKTQHDELKALRRASEKSTCRFLFTLSDKFQLAKKYQRPPPLFPKKKDQAHWCHLSMMPMGNEMEIVTGERP